MSLVAIVVLNDGSTFTDVRGCSILIANTEDYERVVASGGDAQDIPAIMEIGLDCVGQGFINANKKD